MPRHAGPAARPRFLAAGALTDPDSAIYFALATYTTVGYGDVALDQGLRICAEMAAVTGLINFGIIITAYLVATVRLVLPGRAK